VSEDLARRAISLPITPCLEPDIQDRIIDVVRAALHGNGLIRNLREAI